MVLTNTLGNTLSDQRADATRTRAIVINCCARYSNKLLRARPSATPRRRPVPASPAPPTTAFLDGPDAVRDGPELRPPSAQTNVTPPALLDGPNAVLDGPELRPPSIHSTPATPATPGAGSYK